MSGRLVSSRQAIR